MIWTKNAISDKVVCDRNYKTTVLLYVWLDAIQTLEMNVSVIFQVYSTIDYATIFLLNGQKITNVQQSTIIGQVQNRQASKSQRSNILLLKPWQHVVKLEPKWLQILYSCALPTVSYPGAPHPWVVHYRKKKCGGKTEVKRNKVKVDRSLQKYKISRIKTILTSSIYHKRYYKEWTHYC